MKCVFPALVMAAVLMTGCTSLKSVSQTSIPSDRSHPVSASANQWTFIGIAFSNSFVNRATDDIKSQCQGGKIEGILTKYDDTYFFPIVIRHVDLSGFCLKGDA